MILFSRLASRLAGAVGLSNPPAASVFPAASGQAIRRAAAPAPIAPSERPGHRLRIGDHVLHPDTLRVGYGYDPGNGPIKPPVQMSSTFQFARAEDMADCFDHMAGRKPLPAGESAALIYARFNHQNMQVLEDRLAVSEGGEAALVFSAGMAAIATTLLAHCAPGDVILHSQPLYGGTETLLTNTLAKFGFLAEGFTDGLDAEQVHAAADRAAQRGRVGMIVIETPSNPLNTLVDFALMRAVADRIGERQGDRPLILCDNTLLGPQFQQPLAHGIDLSAYSLTKYVGGHSDLIAGAVIGRGATLAPIRKLRGAIGTQLDPHTSSMLTRSVETLSIRMARAEQSASAVVDALVNHPQVRRLHHLSLLPGGSKARAVYDRQCSGAGSTFSIDLQGGRADAFRVLNRLRVFKLAVSLGGTESLASHPASTTHSGVPAETRARSGVSDSTVRLSVGLEHPDDLVADVCQALSA